MIITKIIFLIYPIFSYPKRLEEYTTVSPDQYNELIDGQNMHNQWELDPDQLTEKLNNLIDTRIRNEPIFIDERFARLLVGLFGLTWFVMKHNNQIE